MHVLKPRLLGKLRPYGFAATLVLLSAGVAAWHTHESPPSAEAIVALLHRAADGRDEGARQTLKRWADRQTPAAQQAYAQLLLHDPDPAHQRQAAGYLEAAATQGNALAARQLGDLFRTGGAGLVIAPRVAQRWYLDAAARGDAEAARKAALFYLDAPRSADNAREARRWLLKAANGGDGHAMFLLGNQYAAGGAQADKAAALKWYEAAADQDFIPALETLALAYERGDLGVAADPVHARLMRQEAAEALLHHSRQ